MSNGSSKSHEAEARSFGIVFAIYWVLIVPFISYQLKLFWDSRGLPIIKKRQPMLNIIYVSTVLFNSAIIRPVLLILSIFLLYDIHIFAMTLRIGCLFISALLFSFRTFIIIFDFNYNLAVFKKRCLAAVLSPEYDYQNWWLSHKQTFGKTKFIAPYIAILLVIAIIIGIILGIFNIFWCKMFVVINFIIVVFEYGFMSKYIVSHRDQFGVKKEIIYTALVWIVLITTYVLIFYLPDQWIHIDTDDRDLTLLCIETVCTTILMLISTWWVNRKSVSHQTVGHSEFKNLRLTSKSIVNVHGNDNNKDKDDEYISMDKTLSHFQGYSLFMEYLLEELSIENLLFITEIVHLKHLFYKLLRKKRKIENKNKKIARLKAMSVSKRKNTNSKTEEEENKYNQSLPSYISSNPLNPCNASVPSTANNSLNLDENEIDIRKFTLSITNSDYDTSFDSDNEDESDRKETEYKKRDRLDTEDDPVPIFKNTFSTLSGTTTSTAGTARVNDTNIHQNNDWKVIKRKYVLNPQDEHLPFISKSIYKSVIMKENDFFIKINMIFDKYILSSAVYEINIKYNHRKKLMTIYKEKYEKYSNNNNTPKTPSSPSIPSVSITTPNTIQLPSIVEDKSNKSDTKSSDTKQEKLTDEEYVALNSSVSIQDVQIFDKSAQSIMSLLRSSYIEFCKTKEYKSFADAYKGSEKLDIFTALRGETDVCHCFKCFL